MPSFRSIRILASLGAAVAGATALAPAAVHARGSRPPRRLTAPNPAGVAATTTPTGKINLSHAFFTQAAPNGRTCASCHDPAAGWSITPALVEHRFAASGGLDPIFRPHDGAVAPTADVSTEAARRVAYGPLLSKGLIRIGLPVPETAEFELEIVDDPYAFATASELSLFRRPLPSTNLGFAAPVMWDGRESRPGQTLVESLASQAEGALHGHGQVEGAIAPELIAALVQFEGSLFTAQVTDLGAGALDENGARGGPEKIASFLPAASGLFKKPPVPKDRLFNDWLKYDGKKGDRKRAMASIARGELLFHTMAVNLSGVRGLNDDTGQLVIVGTCATCHSAPGSGSDDLGRLMDVGVSDPTRRTNDLPLYTFRNRTTGAEIDTTDPGRALITGAWRDMNRFKIPTLRGLAARAPYFHDGSASTLEEVVSFYDTRFRMALPTTAREDLVAYLKAL
jgi:cytochrome c peroxidase